jgi:glutathione S-transferase
VSQDLPILYSFRRCPYAIRARLAIEASGLLVQLREVDLKAKPPELLAASPKGTVPVLIFNDGTVLEESLDGMAWALAQHDPGDWRRLGSDPQRVVERQRMAALIATNDGRLKHLIDRYKYGHRHPGTDPLQHREEALTILREWNGLLEAGGWLLGERPSMADVAVLPFVRQFRLADPGWFDALEDLAPLQAWLGRFRASPELATAMAPQAPWQPGDSPRLFPPKRCLHHLALASEWEDALRSGSYHSSTRGLGLAEVGFIHASFEHQLAATHARFFADAPDMVRLQIDPARLAVPLALESAPDSDELFPHLYGPLNLEAVVAVDPYP